MPERMELMCPANVPGAEPCRRQNLGVYGRVCVWLRMLFVCIVFCVCCVLFAVCFVCFHP